MPTKDSIVIELEPCLLGKSQNAAMIAEGRRVLGEAALGRAVGHLLKETDHRGKWRLK